MAFPRRWPRTTPSFLFVVPNPSAVRRLSTALACTVPGRSCASTTSAGIITNDCGIFLERSLTVEAKKKKAKNSYGLHLNYLYIEHKAVERKNNEVPRDRSLFTQLQTRPSRNERQRSFVRIFLPTMADIKFHAKVSIAQESINFRKSKAHTDSYCTRSMQGE